MCGIAGLYDTAPGAGGPELLRVAEAMNRAIAHRGPDDEGVWQDPDVPLVLAQRRLSIIDLSAEGHQPKESHSGRYMTVYNGEIYNFPALRSELESAGVKFRGHSDTEVMLSGFDVWGIDRTLQKLNGMFALVIWDRRERMLHLVRDRIGKKPLYVGWAASALVFGSELKALRAHPRFSASVSRQAAALYMRYAYVPAPFSIYEDVWQLPAACRMVLRPSELRAGEDLKPLITQYWSHPRMVEAARDRPAPKSDREAVDGLEAVLQEAVRRRMISDVPLGAFLSGGIDSSVVVALMQKVSDRPVKTFSIGFDDRSYNEAAHARSVADHLGTDHHEMIMRPADALAVVPQIPEIYDEPFADPSQIPTFLVAKMARQQVTVALTGDGGDEMLAGYHRYALVPELWKRTGWMPHAMRVAAARAIRVLPADLMNRAVPVLPRFGDKLQKAADLLEQDNAFDVYRRLVANWRRPEELVIGGSEPLIPLTREEWRARGLNFTEGLMYGDLVSYLPDDILVKVDRASMAVALEARAPLLDVNVFAYCWSLPLAFKIRNGKGKWALRELLARYMPRALFERPKQGFGMPVAEWLRADLRGWAEDLLAPERLRREGYLNASIVLRAWTEHLEGSRNHATRLWCVLMFQAWHDRWMN